ncbi:MAG: TetR family transcriptional regulator [Pseudolabrys sp.]|nr:TetR family transcriptional regulator [Pseudolabrys sp.]
MAYRRTENVIRRLAAREQTILDAAAALASAGGLGAVQIAAVAARAGIAVGTVYRYFPRKTDLVAEVMARAASGTINAVRAAAEAAPGPLSALAAAVAALVVHALRARRLLWSVLGEPAGAELDAAQRGFRRSLANELELRIEAAIAGRHLPEQDARAASAAVLGAVIEGLIGPLAPPPADAAGVRCAVVQEMTLFALRALGVADARARGLVVQLALT